jgi:hypothetical protein
VLTTNEIWEEVERIVEDTGRYPTCDICHRRIPSDLSDWMVAYALDGTLTFLCPECKEVELGV